MNRSFKMKAKIENGVIGKNLKFTEGSHFVVYNGDKNHEGIVIRTDDMKIHFKVKSREYEL